MGQHLADLSAVVSMRTVLAVLALLLVPSTASAAAPPPPGANIPCTPTAARPHPVVLVHGTFDHRFGNWQATGPADPAFRPACTTF